MAITGAGVVVAALAWQCPKVPAGTRRAPQLYALRVQVVNELGDPVGGSSVMVSAGNEPQLLPDGSWEIEVPAAKLPADGIVTVTATHQEWLTATKRVTLASHPNLPVRMVLKAPRTVLLGSVLDSQNRGVAGARVSVLGHAAEVVQSDGDGRFEIPLSAPSRAKVRLHVEHPEHAAKDAFCYLGAACRIWLGT